MFFAVDTIKECESAIDEIKKSFQALSNFQEKVCAIFTSYHDFFRKDF